MKKMSEPLSNPFDPFFEKIREIVREEIAKALNQRRPTKLQFTLGEAAEMLNVEKSWLASRVRREDVPHRRSGHRIYFAQQDIEEIVAQSAVSPKDGKG